MFSTLELVLYFFLPAYVAMFVTAYRVRRRNREAVPSLLPAKPSAPAARENFGEWVAINFGPLGCLPFLPLLLLQAVLSYPYGVIAFLVDKKREARFVDRMKQAGRPIDWEEAKHRLRDPQTGTLLCEMLSTKGPARTWWTRTQSQKSAPFAVCPQMTKGACASRKSLQPSENGPTHDIQAQKPGTLFW